MTRMGTTLAIRFFAGVDESKNQITRATDISARYGGDEFCVILPRTDLEGARIPVNRLMEDFTERCEYPVTLSIGTVQTGPDEVEDPSEMIEKADHKMYEAKKRAKVDGKHHVEE